PISASTRSGSVDGRRTSGPQYSAPDGRASNGSRRVSFRLTRCHHKSCVLSTCTCRTRWTANSSFHDRPMPRTVLPAPMLVQRTPHMSRTPRARYAQRVFSVAGLLLARGACRDNVNDPAEAGYRLTARPGVNAAGRATGTLRSLPLFEVRDASGEAVEGVKLQLAVSSGATLPDATVLTGPDGIARVNV